MPGQAESVPWLSPKPLGSVESEARGGTMFVLATDRSVHMHTCACVYVYVCACVCSAHICAHVHAYICRHVLKHVYTHMHVHDVCTGVHNAHMQQRREDTLSHKFRSCEIRTKNKSYLTQRCQFTEEAEIKRSPQRHLCGAVIKHQTLALGWG